MTPTTITIFTKIMMEKAKTKLSFYLYVFAMYFYLFGGFFSHFLLFDSCMLCEGDRMRWKSQPKMIQFHVFWMLGGGGRRRHHWTLHFWYGLCIFVNATLPPPPDVLTKQTPKPIHTSHKTFFFHYDLCFWPLLDYTVNNISCF